MKSKLLVIKSYAERDEYVRAIQRFDRKRGVSPRLRAKLYEPGAKAYTGKTSTPVAIQKSFQGEEVLDIETIISRASKIKGVKISKPSAYQALRGLRGTINLVADGQYQKGEPHSRHLHNHLSEACGIRSGH